jgi:4-diphosphocytidyl-2-C-methyl-D-erythritol kinase
LTALRETARAKVNLSLKVLGRRTDGYHELESLIAFTRDLAEDLELSPDAPLGLEVEGEFADGLEGSNLILSAARAASDADPALALGSFKLNKRIPVAAGLGGGSADAAAALRLIAQANPGRFSNAALEGLAQGLGADVPACLASRAAIMRGRGEKLFPLSRFPDCAVVLANPQLPLSTAAVYAALSAPKLNAPPQEVNAPDFASFEALLTYLDARGNDLAPAAIRLLPIIEEMLADLGGLEGARLARLTGSGPTCFALFGSPEAAAAAASELARKRPAWWVASSALC